VGERIEGGKSKNGIKKGKCYEKNYIKCKRQVGKKGREMAIGRTNKRGEKASWERGGEEVILQSFRTVHSHRSENCLSNRY
jgi:hypothetical protein